MKKFLYLLSTASLLLILNVATASAQSQFSILPYTNKTPEECKSILNDFEVSQKIPNDSFIQKVAQNQQDAEAAFMANSDFQDADKANQDAQKAMNDCINAHGAGGAACSDQEYAAVDAKNAYDKAKAAKDSADKSFASSSQGVSDNTLSLDSLLGLKDHLLGCAIKTGRISFAMIPYFITYIINFLLGLSGLITVLFVVIGGYHYVIGGLTEEKEKGKQTIMHALMGMGVALLAWTVVTVIMNAVTG